MLNRGDKVVFIGWPAFVVDLSLHGQLPVPNVVYTVREAGIPSAAEARGLRLVEIINPPQRFVEGFMEPCFAEKAFRKVVSPGIEALNEIARKTSAGEPVKIKGFEEPKRRKVRSTTGKEG